MGRSPAKQSLRRETPRECVTGCRLGRSHHDDREVLMHADVCEHTSPMIEQSTGGSETWSAKRSIVRPAIYVDQETSERRRHHLHESVLQRGVKDAARAARIPRPATPHS